MEQRILEQAREFRPGVESVGELMAGFERREPWAVPLVERLCSYISIAISNTMCYINPPSIIMGGKLINDYPFIFDLAIDKYNNMRYEPLYATAFKRSILKKDATCRGGAYMATDCYIDMLLRAAGNTRGVAPHL